MNKFPCFIHIEKCAGTTLHHTLKYNFPGYITLRPWYFWSNEEGNSLSARELKSLQSYFPFLSGIGGHTARTFLGYEKVVNKPISYFTFLRDPIERYMSHYNHQVNKMNINWTLDEFLNERRFNNFITKRIAGKEDIKLAKEYIYNHYNFVGIFESFDESLLLMNQIIFMNNLKPFYEMRNDSKTDKKVRFKDLSKEVQSKIINNNYLDIEIYNEVKQNLYPIFKNRYKGNLEADLNEFKEKNSNYKYNALRYNVIKSTRLITEKIIEPLSHKKQ